MTALTQRPRRTAKFDVRIHQEALDWQEGHAHAGPRNRFTLTVQQLLARGTARRKAVQGAGAGWSRTGLGGNGGFQWYLWWAPAGTPPLAHLDLPSNAIVVRAVRHHDDTDQGLDAGDPADWLPFAPADLAAFEPPLTAEQQAIVGRAGRARSLRGAPGAGKTVALFADVAGMPPGRGLYLTYGHRLCADARRWFETHAPADVDVRVLGVDELTEALAGPDLPPPLSAKAGSEQLATALADFREPLGPWAGHHDALYAELHAHFFGRESRQPSRTAYRNARKGALGEGAANVAAAVGQHLRERELRMLFPAPTRARAALEKLKGAPLPPDLQGLDWIWVDEVQDLTCAEQELVVELRARTRPDGGTRLLVAGDEGQTLRPTDFSWGETNDLLKERIEAPLTTTLPTNLRSPANVALVVARVGDLYKHLDKDERPRGSPDTGAGDVVPGRIVRVRYRDDDERARLVALVADTPDAVVVGLDAAPMDGVLTPEDVKGLEFRVTVVLDAGAACARLDKAAQKLVFDNTTLTRTWVRTDIDRLRVAASRATDVLVLADRAGAREADVALNLLLAELEDAFRDQSLDDLERLLGEDLGNATDAVDALNEDVRRLLEAAPQEALVKARRAVSLLGPESSAASVQDPNLRRETHRLRGMAALAVALRRPGPDARGLFDEANRALHRAGASAAARGVLAVRDLPQATEKAAERARELSENLATIREQVPEIEHAFREAICRAAKDFDDGDLPRGGADRRGVLVAMAHLARELGGLHPDLHVLALRMLWRVAVAFAEEGKAKDALPLLERLEPREWAYEARCYEKLGRLDEAGSLYERAGNLQDALRVYREAGLVDEAVRVAGLAGSDEPALAWLHGLVGALRAGPRGPLTDAERKLVKGLLNGALAQGAGEAAKAG